MSPASRPTLRSAVASRLRSVARRLQPEPNRAPALPAPPSSPALLVRYGGRWWYRDELAELVRDQAAGDAGVQLLS